MKKAIAIAIFGDGGDALTVLPLVYAAGVVKNRFFAHYGDAC
ncbi:hypothetical protein [Niabella hirudinis]